MARKGQLITFALIYFAYVTYYVAQKNYAFWLLSLVNQEGWRKEEAGIFGSSFQISSGISKLLNGPLVDSMSPTLALAGSLGVIGVCNLLMFRSASNGVNVALWAINGAFQGVGWPALARIFLAWFPDRSTRGTWYSILSTNQNLGSTIVPLLLPFCMSIGGWKAALLIPAAASGCFSLVLFLFLRDRPPSVAQTGAEDEKSAPKKAAAVTAAPPSFATTATRLVLLGLAYCFISIIRQGVGDWSPILLGETRGLSVEQSGRCLVLLEIGGLFGGLAGGVLSDRAFQGRRAPVMCIFSLLATPIVYLIFCTSGSTTLGSVEAIGVLYAALGFFTFAPHVLLGLFAREVVPENYASTAGGFVKALGQMGGAFAGAPLSALVSSYGWAWAAWLWLGCGVAAALCFAPMWNTQGTSQGARKAKQD